MTLLGLALVDYVSNLVYTALVFYAQILISTSHLFEPLVKLTMIFQSRLARFVMLSHSNQDLNCEYSACLVDDV